MSALLLVISTFGLRSNDVSISRSRLFQKLVFSLTVHGHQLKNFLKERFERETGQEGEGSRWLFEISSDKIVVNYFFSHIDFPRPNVSLRKCSSRIPKILIQTIHIYHVRFRVHQQSKSTKALPLSRYLHLQGLLFFNPLCQAILTRLDHG